MHLSEALASSCAGSSRRGLANALGSVWRGQMRSRSALVAAHHGGQPPKTIAPLA
jgi:hypothetical protein